MYYYNLQVTFLEVPGEISLCFSISGCPLRCSGCHSPFLWKEKNGVLLSKEKFTAILKKYASYASCVLFMGGEWHPTEIVEYLKIAKKEDFKTCLYTGKENVATDILKNLTWIKTGKWEHTLGGLESENTNQKFIEIKTNKILNHLFHKKQNS